MTLERLTPAPVLEPDDILVVGCLRNEALRLPDFLAHHRKLGVARFFLIDNGSTDGTVDYLRQQPDVCLFHTSDSYASSRCGVDWLNAVLGDYAVGHWTLILDADELFVFPGFEDTGLASFVAWVEDQGHDAVCAPMLDMYPRGPLAATGYAAGESLIDTCRWFDADGYERRRIPGGPEVLHRGGPRHRLFWEGREVGFPSPVLTKIPLVKWRADLELTASTHVLRGARLSQVTGLLMHFKFLQDFAPSVAEEQARGEHFMSARQYSVYHDRMAENANLRVRFEGSLRFRDSAQLVARKLMTAPEDYPFRKKPARPQATENTGGGMNGHWKDFLIREEEDRDLGGNLRHGDGQTVTPKLWTALIDRYAPRTMLDVGAGEGHAAAFFARRQVLAHGFDGLLRNVRNARHPIALHDLKKGSYIYPCDLVYCVEVVEHVAEAYLDNLLDTLANAPVIVMTHALPGQRGHHHVNLQPSEYWLEKFAARGYRPAIDQQRLRDIAAADCPDSFFSKTGLVLLKQA